MVNFENVGKIIKNILKKEFAVLWLFALAAGFVLIVLQNYNKLPLGQGDFIFLAILALLVALYKPRWIFFLFIGFIPLENIILASGFLPMQLRPYQFLGGILIVAIAILYASKQLKFKILKPVWLDWAIFSLVPFSFLALLNTPNKSVSLKNNLVLVSFILLYFLIRNFLRNKNDLIKTAFFFFGSYIIVSVYGFYQVFADKFDLKSFEVMFGRPNSTFTEPDWLGIYLCFALAVLILSLYSCHPEPFGFAQDKLRRGIHKEDKMDSHSAHAQIPPLRFASVGITRIILLLLLFLNLTLLILTLSRSAWVGSGAIFILYLFLSLPGVHKSAIADLRSKNWRLFLREGFVIPVLIVVSVISIRVGKLSKFDIFDRARSTATHEQKITIACENGANIPQIISSTDELAKFSCRHINLEEIAYYKSQEKFVAETFRKDPNVMTRSAIYRKSWEIIKAHPILGIGFGTITQSLGTDERGAGLNESNIFLQVWAGCGILGLIAFVAVFGYLFIYAFRRVSPVCPMNKFIGCPIEKDDFEKILNIFLILAIISLTIPNLFNAGLLMGIFWLGLAVIVSIQKIHSH